MDVPRIILEGALATGAVVVLAVILGWAYHQIADRDKTYTLRQYLYEGFAGLLLLTIAFGFLFCVGMAVSYIGAS